MCFIAFFHLCPEIHAIAKITNATTVKKIFTENFFRKNNESNKSRKRHRQVLRIIEEEQGGKPGFTTVTRIPKITIKDRVTKTQIKDIRSVNKKGVNYARFVLKASANNSLIMKEMLYEVRYLKSSEDMILALYWTI